MADLETQVLFTLPAWGWSYSCQCMDEYGLNQLCYITVRPELKSESVPCCQIHLRQNLS